MRDQSALERAGQALADALTEQEMPTVLVEGKLVISQSWNGIESVDPAPLVRAVLAAIRDVDAGSPAMLVAGKEALYSCSADPELEDARGCWQAMIDKALEEGEDR
jgi:hypothetical protein